MLCFIKQKKKDYVQVSLNLWQEYILRYIFSFEELSTENKPMRSLEHLLIPKLHSHYT